MELCAIAQEVVGLSRSIARNPSSKRPERSRKLGSMKNRFPTDRRTTWRERFLAIARELEATGVQRRESLDALRGARARFFPPRSLRGVRLGCVRAA
jgi:hypothetical protein